VTDDARRRWFLTRAERGNPSTCIDDNREDAWTTGNLVRPLVHGATYFRRLHDELDALVAGDFVYFTDWRGDGDEQLLPGGPTISEMLCRLARSGVHVRGLIWRSHTDLAAFSGKENAALSAEINEAGGQVQLDQRVRLFGSHHQKLFIIRHRDAPQKAVAYVGGIDLCHARRDDAEHFGDPQHVKMDKRYGPQAPWHDAAIEVRGPAVGDVLRTFAERWDDPHPLDRRTPVRMLEQRMAHMPRHPPALPEHFPNPPVAGPHAVQVLRTYGARRPIYPYAPKGERSIARAYEKAFAAARSLIYVEDQYLWSALVARGIARALRRERDLRVIVVVPRYPDADGPLSGPPNRLGQIRALQILRAAGGDRVGVFDLENAAGTPIYVHAKVCIVDDVWFTVGSDNFNRRSWTNDSEITCAVIDETVDGREPHDPGASGDRARRLARDLRLELWAEHLGLAADDERLLDARTGFDLWTKAATEIDAWHAGGMRSQRPRGRVRRHEPDPVSRVKKLWALPAYARIFDPDGRPFWLRRTNRF
jgi:phosphatidylserine/phosphatidylglycerophosphate/cardiolipin synthase-like enzyme